MYLRLELEGDLHRTLEFIPLAVRRKLALSGLKLSLRAWTAMTRAERLAVCHLPVDGPGDLEVYRETLAGFAERAGHPVAPLEGGPVDASAWSAASPIGSAASRCTCPLRDANTSLMKRAFGNAASSGSPPWARTQRS